MPLYLIHRAVGEMTQAEMDASGFRAIVCAYQFPGLKWVTSYWHKEAGDLTCIYHAESIEQIREHASQSRIPCDAVVEITEVSPEPYIRG